MQQSSHYSTEYPPIVGWSAKNINLTLESAIILSNLTEQQLQRYNELKNFIKKPSIKVKSYPIPRPQFIKYIGTATPFPCPNCHFKKGKTKHVCSVINEHTWEECCQKRTGYLKGHPEEEKARTMVENQWLENKTKWEEDQTNLRELDSKLWQLLKVIRTEEKNNLAKKCKAEHQFQSPPSSINSFKEVQGILPR